MSTVRDIRLGWLAGTHALAVLLHALAFAFAIGLRFYGTDLPSDSLRELAAGWVLASVPLYVAIGGGVVLFAAASAFFVRLRRIAAETRGRTRSFIGTFASIALVVAEAAGAILVAVVSGPSSSLELDLAFGIADQSRLVTYAETIDTLAFAAGLSIPLYIVAGAWVLSLVVSLASVGSSFFLLSGVTRRRLWAVVDIVLFAAFAFALWTMPFVPRDDSENGRAGVALAITTLFSIRLIVTLSPKIFDAVETWTFSARVAARMLRGKKNGFLTAIGILALGAVSFSSCTLATVLSVMGGFRDDLQRKILGNHAHVVVDREYGTFEGWDPLIARIHEVPGVTGVSPYVAGEVMVTSSTNLGGAVLRGIDPSSIAEVTDLTRNMRFGRLEYLADPSLMNSLSMEDMNGSLRGTERLFERYRDGGATDADGGLGDAGPSDAGVAPAVEALLDRPLRNEAPRDHALDRTVDDVLAELDRRAGELAEEDTPSTAALPRRASPEELDGLLNPGSLLTGDETFDHDPFLLGELPDRAPSTTTVTPPSNVPGLIVGQELARSLRLHVGDEVSVVSPNGDLGPTGPMPRSRPFRIAGIFYTGMFEYDMQMAYAELGTAQRFLNAGTAITGIEVKLDDWERAEALAPQIRAVVGRSDLRVRSWQEVNRNLFGALQLEKLAMFVCLGIAILVASFCVVSTLVLMVQEKRGEVAILKAMGADDRSIVHVFLMQGLFIGVIGALSGLGLGYVTCFAVGRLDLIPINPEVYYIDHLPVSVEPLDFLAVGIAAVIVCVIATIYPAILAARIRPVEPLRGT